MCALQESSFKHTTNYFSAQGRFGAADQGMFPLRASHLPDFVRRFLRRRTPLCNFRRPRVLSERSASCVHDIAPERPSLLPSRWKYLEYGTSRRKLRAVSSRNVLIPCLVSMIQELSDDVIHCGNMFERHDSSMVNTIESRDAIIASTVRDAIEYSSEPCHARQPQSHLRE